MKIEKGEEEEVAAVERAIFDAFLLEDVHG